LSHLRIRTHLDGNMFEFVVLEANNFLTFRFRILMEGKFRDSPNKILSKFLSYFEKYLCRVFVLKGEIKDISLSMDFQ
jgi:hypothetical protein